MPDVGHVLIVFVIVCVWCN